jgi:hypothetical protein
MCPVCLTTFGLYVAGGLSAGGFTTYLATRLLSKRGDQQAGAIETPDERREAR